MVFVCPNDVQTPCWPRPWHTVTLLAKALVTVTYLLSNWLNAVQFMETKPGQVMRGPDGRRSKAGNINIQSTDMYRKGNDNKNSDSNPSHRNDKKYD